MASSVGRTFGRLLAERAKQAGVAYGKSGGSSSGGSGPPQLGRILGGGGAIIALVVGGLTLNASLFNGESAHRQAAFMRRRRKKTSKIFSHCDADLLCVQSTVVIVQSSIRG